MTSPNTPLFAHLARTLRRHHPGGIPLPYMIPGFTDATAYARLGTKCYGFSPVRFEPGSDASFSGMYHGDNERIPVDGAPERRAVDQENHPLAGLLKGLTHLADRDVGTKGLGAGDHDFADGQRERLLARNAVR